MAATCTLGLLTRGLDQDGEARAGGRRGGAHVARGLSLQSRQVLRGRLGVGGSGVQAAEAAAERSGRDGGSLSREEAAKGNRSGDDLWRLHRECVGHGRSVAHGGRSFQVWLPFPMARFVSGTSFQKRLRFDLTILMMCVKEAVASEIFVDDTCVFGFEGSRLVSFVRCVLLKTFQSAVKKNDVSSAPRANILHDPDGPPSPKPAGTATPTTINQSCEVQVTPFGSRSQDTQMSCVGGSLSMTTRSRSPLACSRPRWEVRTHASVRERRRKSHRTPKQKCSPSASCREVQERAAARQPARGHSQNALSLSPEQNRQRQHTTNQNQIAGQGGQF